jgi:hypothetical protein
MTEMTPFRRPKFASRKLFTSNSRRLKHIKLNRPDHLQVGNNLTIPSAPRRVEPAQRSEFNVTKDSVEDLDSFPYLEHVENIAD